MIDATPDSTRKGSNHTATAMTHTGIMGAVPHRPALSDGEKSHKLQYNELQEVPTPGTCCSRVITDDDTGIVGPDERLGNLQI